MAWNKNDDTDRLKDMDERLKDELVIFWFESARHKVVNDYVKAFEGYSIIVDMLSGYDYDYKKTLEDLIEVIREHIYSLGGKPINLAQEILFYQKKIAFRDLVNKLSNLIPQACTKLNLWFKNVGNINDIDVKISLDIFNDEITNINTKRKELKTLGLDEIIDLMPINHLHALYSKAIISRKLINVL